MSFRPLLKWLAVAMGALPIVIVLLLAIALFSETAARSLWAFATDSVDGLRSGELSGRLAGPLEIQDLHFSNESISIDAARLGFDWQLEKLLFAELYIGRLRATDVRVHSHAQQTSTEDSAFALPDRLPLPVMVRVNDAKINDLQFISGDNEPVQIDALLLRGQAGSGEVLIEKLSVDGPKLSASAELNTQLWNNYQTDANLNWRYGLRDIANTSGNLQADGDLDNMRVALLANADTADMGSYQLKVNALARAQSLTLEEALLRLKNTDTLLSVRGDLDFSLSVPGIDAQLEWHNLHWPLATEPGDTAQLSSPSGNALLQGTLNQYAASLNGKLNTPQVQDGRVSLNATGSQKHVHLSTFELQALRGTATGEATINWFDGIESSFQMSGAGLDPGELFPQWPGAIDFELLGEQSGNTLTLSTLSAKGTLREQSLTLNSSANYDGKQLTVPELALRSGTTQLDASGSIGELMNFEWDLDSPDLSNLVAGASGEIASSGRLSGALETAVVQANLRARNLRYDAYKIGSVDAKASVDLGSASDSTIDLSASSLLIAGNQINTLRVQGSGRVDDHSLQLRAAGEAAELALTARGGLHEARWQGELQVADVSPAGLETWSLRNAVQLALSANEQTASETCWVTGASSLCVQGKRSFDRQAGVVANTESQFSADNFPLAYLQALLPTGVELDGTFSAKGEFEQTASEPMTASAQIDTSAIQVTAIDKAGEQHVDLLAIEPGKLTVNVASNGGQINVRLPFTEGGGIEGDINAAQNITGLNAAKLGGEVTLDIPALDVVAAFVPELKSVEGKLNAVITLSGSVAEPKPGGQLVLADGVAELATPGLRISEINFKARSEDRGAVVYSASAVSDEGDLAVDGRSVFSGEAPISKLTVKGDRFQLWNTTEARVWASPDLTLNVQNNQMTVDGKVLLPKARVTPQELPSGAVDVSSDQIIIREDDEGEALAGTRDALAVVARLGIELGDDVTVEGFGFKGAIAGGLGVVQQPGKPLVASGELNIVDGEYRAYGQGLVIDRGQILFAGGAIDNPGLSVRALRRPAKDIVVGVNVRGELRQPELNLFSEPSMSQSDQLSWLVLGRPLQNASGAESDYITQAALALGIRGGNSFTKGIGESLGVDTFAIQTGSGEAGAASDVNQAALVIGKYLTPKLYVSYGVGLLEAVNTVKLRYLMTERWNLETESSAISSGGDISYSFEK